MSSKKKSKRDMEIIAKNPSMLRNLERAGKTYDMNLWKPYTSYRIKRIIKELGCELDNIYQGYKANRRPGYCELYRIIRTEDRKVLNTCVSMDTLRRFFASYDFPLQDNKSARQDSISKSIPFQ